MFETELKELQEGDIVLTVDVEGNEELTIITRVEGGIYSKGYIDHIEIFETYEEIINEYRSWHLIQRKEDQLSKAEEALKQIKDMNPKYIIDYSDAVTIAKQYFKDKEQK